MVEALPVFTDVDITGDGKHAWGDALELSLDIVVDGSKTYHLDLSRIPPNEDPTLKRIVIRDTADTDYLFYPIDEPDLTEFDLRFPVGNPTLYMIKTDKVYSGTDVSVTDTLDVSSGSGVWMIYCTAESGATVTYTINALTEGTGTATTLRKLMLSSPVDTFATTPPFQSGISNYTLGVPSGTDTLIVMAASTDSYATMVYEDTIVISGGSATVTVDVTSEDGNNTQTYTVEVTVAGTGVEDDDANNKIRVHHNSAMEQLLIFNTDDVTHVEIYSITGKLHISKDVSYQNTLEISTSGLSGGVYVVRLNNSNKQIQTTKFIK